jgi:hypothetical protein
LLSLRHSSLGALAFAVIASVVSCDKPEIAPRVGCPDFQPPSLTRLDLAGAKAAYLHAETKRNIRYQEALSPGYFVRETRPIVLQSKIDRGQVCFEQLYNIGQLLFEHEYSFADGLGRDDARTREDPFRKVHEGELGGPETNTCTSCHWRGGPAGAGAVQDNSQIGGDGVNIQSADARNPPALLGSGVVQALSQEMSRELQGQRRLAVKSAKNSEKESTVELISKGVSFGYIQVSASGAVDTSKLIGIDADLIVRPFGWRGEFATLRDFTMASTQLHLGIQSEDLMALPAGRLIDRGTGPEDDRDNDGFVAELSAGQLTALISYLATLQVPIVAAPEVLHGFPAAAEGLSGPEAHNFYQRFSEGQRLFDTTGCTVCHTPMMVLNDPVFRTRSEVTGKEYAIDLSKLGEEPRLTYDKALGGYPVWLFSDMRRHDLGEGAAGKHPMKDQAPGEYLTRRLWGLASTPPYFYDGRAPTVDGAIAAHGGEGAFAAEAFAELSHVDKGSLRIYLLSLRRAPQLVVP